MCYNPNITNGQTLGQFFELLYDLATAKVLECETPVCIWWFYVDTYINSIGLPDEVDVIDSHCEIRGLPIKSTTWRESDSMTNLQKCDCRAPKAPMQECVKYYPITSIINVLQGWIQVFVPMSGKIADVLGLEWGLGMILEIFKMHCTPLCVRNNVACINVWWCCTHHHTGSIMSGHPLYICGLVSWQSWNIWSSVIHYIRVKQE